MSLGIGQKRKCAKLGFCSGKKFQQTSSGALFEWFILKACPHLFAEFNARRVKFD